MLFNSFEFVLFFIAVFVVYYIPLKENIMAQNVLLLAASWFFYGYASWKMLPLLIISTIVFYFLGQAIARARTERANTLLTWLGIVLGLCALLYFKYLNFFIEQISALIESLGFRSNLHSLKLIMPLGISFFTFRLISYVVEIHRETIEPETDFIAFANYVAFFPCILSGPIDRPAFIRQFHKKRSFDYDKATDGLRQILWGFFKKAVIADNCASYVDTVWADMAGYGGSTLLLASILYLFQVYADFSGYSDMAIGIGKILGFKITDNFKFPLFALNIADFWRRWHISLTSWMTDYVFMPLNLSFRTMGRWGIVLAIVINMFLVGIWHGANWTYALYGFYHGLLFVPLVLSGAFFKKDKLKTNVLGLPCLKDFGRIVLTWALVIIGLVIFRSESVGDAFSFFRGTFDGSLFSAPWLKDRMFYIPTFMSIVLLLVVEWVQRSRKHALEIDIKNGMVRWSIYVILALAIVFLGTKSEAYIYFQF